MNEERDEALPILSRDSVEFSAALLIGAAIGLITARALRPERTPRERIQRRIKGPAKSVRRRGRDVRDSARDVRESAGDAVRKSGRLGGELRDLGAEFVRATREEIDTARHSGAEGRGAKGIGAALDALRAFRARISPRD
ncbi:MAG: hypothetical protein EA351_05445 [Gemmatimonadales bacterium]|nr:MAG: hypothetical protein EA351_05445 [Gemmatimonadales bacterium]